MDVVRHFRPSRPQVSSPYHLLELLCSIFRKVRWTQGGYYSGSLCLFRSFSLQGTVYEQALMCAEYLSFGSGAESVLQTGKQKEGLVPTFKASATNIWSDNKRQRRLSHDNPSAAITSYSNTWKLLQNGLDQQNPTDQLLRKSRQKTVRF